MSTTIDDMHTLVPWEKERAKAHRWISAESPSVSAWLACASSADSRKWTGGEVGITQVLVSAYETDRACFAVEMAVRFA